jgi:hypothetical protein
MNSIVLAHQKMLLWLAIAELEASLHVFHAR